MAWPTAEGLATRVRRARHGEIRDYLPTDWEGGAAVGLPSDDTQLAFWTLEQLLEDGGLIPEHLATRFASSGRIFGIGQTVLAFLTARSRGATWLEASQHSAGNGALMRIAPVLLPHLREPTPALWADAALAGAVTHNDRASIASCVSLVELLWGFLGGRGSGEPWLERFIATFREVEGDRGRYATRAASVRWEGSMWRFLEDELRSEETARRSVADACDRWYSGAYLMETLPAVLLILSRYADDPEEAIVRAVNDTWDNDTVAAIVGTAVGALQGARALPARWMDGLLGRTRRADDGRVFELIDAAPARWVPA